MNDQREILIEEITEITDSVRKLIFELDAELSSHYNEDQRHGLNVNELVEPRVRFFVISVDGVAAACGGVKIFEDFGEVKRMFVLAPFRGQGLADLVIQRIRDEIVRSGLNRLMLETGVHSLAAIRFYERLGFVRCEAFGQYLKMAPSEIVTSLFFEKTLN
ncbi:N-acetyltransferase [bacterium]|nr:N-acetyltransferase [bacterium]